MLLLLPFPHLCTPMDRLERTRARIRKEQEYRTQKRLKQLRVVFLLPSLLLPPTSPLFDSLVCVSLSLSSLLSLLSSLTLTLTLTLTLILNFIFKAFIALFNAVGGRAQIGEKVRFGEKLHFQGKGKG